MKSVFTIITLLVLCLYASAQHAGSLDKSFADTGVFVSRTVTGICHDILIQKDGKIVSIGEVGYDDIPGFLLLRYNTDGTPDLSFGDSGRVLTAVSTISSVGSYGAIQEDGKIVVVGQVVFETGGIGYNDLVVVRYNTDGSIDSSFGVNGIARERIEDPFSFASGIAIQAGGKIVVGGYTNDRYFSTTPTFFLLRYNPDGSPDLSFGNKGLYQEKADLLNEAAIGFALQPDGRILLGATNYFATPFFFFVRRYTTDGMPDREFGTNGEARLSFPPGTFGGDMYAIALREDGRIVCGGSNALAQFNGDGSIDKTFGKDGFVYVDSTNTNTNVRDIALQPDGKVIAGGTWVLDKNNNTAFVLFRYEANGAVDSSFGDDGVALTQINIYPDADAVALQKDGKVILGGYSRTLNPNAYYVTLVRYNGDESKRQIVTTRIKRWLQHHGISWQMDNSIRYYNVQRSNDGGVTYQPVAKIYNNHQTQYNYEEAVGKTNDLYRVAAVGKDGSRTYSNSVLVGNESSVSVFPNPVRSTMQLQGLSTESKTNISIVDFTGTVRFSVTINGSTYSINTSNLQPGNYFIKIETNKTVTTQPFVKE